MKRFFIAALCIVAGVGFIFAQATARQESLIFDEESSVNLTVNHKAYSAITFAGTVTNSTTGAVNITGKTGTLGFKRSLSDSSFFAEKDIVITDGSNGQFTASFQAANWATNVTVKTRFYGDLRLSDYGNTLPSIDLWLHPSANSGSESNYVSPTTGGFETNFVLISDLNRVNFGSGIDSAVTNDGGTNRLTLTVTQDGDTTNAAAINADFATPTNYTPSAADVSSHLKGIDVALGVADASITANATAIGLNSDTGAVNTAGIAANAAAIDLNSATGAVNTAGIAANASDISDNATAIGLNSDTGAVNTASIAANATAIDLNSATGGVNTAGIAANAADISDNATAIGLNSDTGAVNTASIAANASDISDNATAIGLNSDTGAVNTASIAANTTAIGTKLPKDGTEPMTGDLNMGGNSVTNISTNSLAFTDGGYISTAGSNVIRFVAGTGETNILANTTTTDALDSRIGVNESDIGKLEIRSSDSEKNIINLAVQVAFENDSASMPLEDGWIVNFNALTGINESLSTNYTLDAGNNLIKPDYSEGDSLPPLKIHLKCNDDAASTSITDDGDYTQAFTSDVNTEQFSISGKINKAFNFQGTSNMLSSGGAAYDSSVATTSGTVCAWIYSTDNSGGQNAWMGAGAGAGMSMRSAGGNGNGVFDDGVGTIIGKTVAAIPEGEWYHVVMIQDGITSGGIIYTNGVLDSGSQAIQRPGLWFDDFYTAAADTINVGDRTEGAPGSLSWLGYIDDVRVYTNVLSQSDVEYIYNSGTGTESNGGASSGGDMWLTSSNFIFNASYSNAFARVLFDMSDSPTLNTDVKFWISSDGGATSNQITLADGGAYIVGSNLHWLTGTNATAIGTNFVWSYFVDKDITNGTYNIGFGLN